MLNIIFGFRHFYDSYKQRDDVASEVMCAYGIMSNHEEKENVSTSSKCTKYIFSPYLSVSFLKHRSMNTQWLVQCTNPIFCYTDCHLGIFQGKLVEDPHSFDKRSCVREMSRINSKVNLAAIDLVIFDIS